MNDAGAARDAAHSPPGFAGEGSVAEREWAAFAALAALYAAHEAECAEDGAGEDYFRCRACGCCCHFEAVEHTLFASGLEVGYCLARAGRPSPATMAATGGERCPYQVDKACTAHAFRPLGCRLYHCNGGEPGASGRSSEAEDERAERYHQALKRLHEKHGIAWDYRPWLVWLRRG